MDRPPASAARAAGAHGDAERAVGRAPLLGAVLVGGASRRLGRPKALVEVGGLTLAERATAALEPVVERVILVGGGPVPPALQGLARLEDAPLGRGAGDPEERGGAGPLAGLLAALRSAPGAAWILCPCDLPWVESAAAAWLAGERRPGRIAALPRPVAGGPVEPLFALYEPEVLPRVEALAAAGVRAPRELARIDGVAVVTPPARLARCWRDVDTAEELAALWSL